MSFTLLLPVLAVIIGLGRVAAALNDYAIRHNREQARAEQRREKQLEKERTAALKAEENQRKAEHSRYMAEQNIDSLQMQKENAQKLYSDIERMMAGNISENQRISYSRQLMALDDKIYRLDNKIAELSYKAELY